MPENLLSPSNILLYGRLMTDLQIDPRPAPPPEGGAAAQAGAPPPEPPPPPRLGQNNFLQAQLADANSRFARIYGFSYEGHYYDLAAPAIFLVHGEGSDPEAFRPGQAPPQSRVSRAPAGADRTGVAGQAGSFSDDMRVWSYDQGDFTIRMDIETGTFEELLLEVEAESDDPSVSYSGARVRGARVRGARVRGARVRGARVRGARVRGGDLDD